MLLLVAVFVETGFVVGGAALIAATRRMQAGERKSQWVKFGTYFLIVHSIVIVASAQRPVFIVVTAMLAAVGAVELAVVTLRHPSGLLAPLLAFCIYTAAASGAVLFAMGSSPAVSLYVYLIVCMLDAYSQLSGQLFGKHALARVISPGKTVEGALGGVLFALLAAGLLRGFAGLGIANSLACGAVLSITGIGGDLLSSSYKRKCGIKDYSNLLLGQGGIIDRFNSFFAAASVAGLFELLRW